MPTAWIENGNPYGNLSFERSFFLDLTGHADVGTYGGVSESLSRAPGSSYGVTFDLGYGGNSGAFGGPVRGMATAAGTSATFTSGSGTPNPAVWDTETVSFMGT